MRSHCPLRLCRRTYEYSILSTIKLNYFAILLVLLVFSFGIGDAYAAHNEQITRGVDDPKIAVSGSGVYVVWGEGSTSEFLDLFFVKSSDNGKTFDDVINLTNGKSFYPDPQITVSKNNIYVVWEDRISEDGIPSIFFTKSNDGGQTFDEPKILDPIDDSYNLIYRPLKIIESNDTLYVFASFWERETQQHRMIFITSNDDGNTFSAPTVLFDDGEWEDFVDFTIHDKTIYVLADDGSDYDEIGNLNLRKIFADGSMSNLVHVNDGKTAASTAHLTISDENIYIAWRAWEDGRWNLAFVKSSDNGQTFTQPRILNSDPTSIDIHGSAGSNIFAYDDLVYVKWLEVYWDGENQTEKTWMAISNNFGDDFEVMIHPMDDLLNQQGLVLSVQEADTLYSMALTVKNSPFNDGAIYFARSNDGRSYTEPVDVLQNNPPSFKFPEIATSGNNIHIVAEGNNESSCVMYAVSHDKGDSFELKQLSPNGNPKKCLGIDEKISTPRHQIESGVKLQDVRCKEDRHKGYVLALRNDNQPVCVMASSYEKMLDRKTISEKSFETIALEAARDYVLSNQDISSSIVDDSLKLYVYMTRNSIPPAFIIKGSFESTTPLYDDSTSLTHDIEITLVQYNKIHYAQLDNEHVLTGIDPSLEKRNPLEKTIVSPTIKTILSPGERVTGKGLIPLVISEVSEGGFDKTTHWTFQSIGYQGDNRDKRWGFLPDKYVVHETVDQDGNDAIDRDRMPENFGIPMPLFIFPVLCDDQRIDGESGWHYTLPTRTDTSKVYFRSTDKGIYPDEHGIYDIQFVSMFRTEVEVLPNFEVLSNQSVLCPMDETRNDATHAYYTRIQFKIDDKWTASYYSPESVVDSEQINERATLLIKIFDDTFGFSQPEFYLQDPQINIEPAESNVLHRNSDDAPIGFFFDSVGMKLTSECLVLPDDRQFCSNEEYSLGFYVNGNKQDDISQYLINEDDKILISYGPDNKQEIENQLKELDSIAKYNYHTLENLMTFDVGTVLEGTYDGDLGFRTAEKLVTIDMENQTEKNDLQYSLSQKQFAYNTLVRQDGDPTVLESIQNDIDKIQSDLNDLEHKKSQYTTEEIFQRVNEIQTQNILMHKIGPDEYQKLVSAKNIFEKKAKDESLPLKSVLINPENSHLKVVLSDNAQVHSTQLKQFESLIEKIMPENTPWEISFSIVD